ncbi:type II toxin-antitoxin system Phd/YefM family antitoxin [Pseudonocardia sp. KRD291]|uniref:type II toxin-antitoxin system Phd/YefM family antitoxin n=1 Tax=Pseudonocardia sp. KRD291 TaxID=2792007 RepID=UPI001C4A11C8|nr:type II toxin-antitoxin system prevent-host-death family antitoxin [Pseudonocardia sp. KRD291]MBW0101359.1 type II toxin-antitoxin system Phd/YefM family antitoxin [Pseudonocardia sp. KRD291]
MPEIPSRELRNDTAGVLRRVESGDEFVVTHRGRPIASLVPFQRSRRGWLPRAELVRRLGIAQSDPGLRSDLDAIAGDTTDDLGPVR